MHSYRHENESSPGMCSYTVQQPQGQLDRAGDTFAWTWQPESCKLYNFRNGGLGTHSAEAMLDSMKDAKLVFVGDSLMSSQYISLKAMLGQYIEALLLDAVHVNGKPHTSANLGFRVQGGMEVWYASHAYLVRPDDKQEVEQASHQSMSASGKLVWDYSMASTSHMGASTPYEHLLSGKNTYLVMSTGAHWKKYSMISYRGMVDNVISYLGKNFQGKRAYIRSSIPEHPGCAGKQDPDPHFQDRINDRLQEYNGHFKEAIGAAGNVRIAWYDVWNMSLPRIDAHSGPNKGDCLHYCQPGLPDFWNFLLASDLMSTQQPS